MLFDVTADIIFENDYVFEHGNSNAIDLPTESYAAALGDLRSSSVLAPKNWGAETNTYLFRELTSKDIQIAKAAISISLPIFRHTIGQTLFPDMKLEVIDFQIVQIGFGCVKLKVMAVVGVLGFGIATYQLGVSNTKIEESGYSVTCERDVTSAPAVKHHLGTILQTSPELLLETQGECLRLKQKAINHTGFSPGQIDGIYGNETAEAERDFAKQFNLSGENPIELYREVHKQLSYKIGDKERLPKSRLRR